MDKNSKRHLPVNLGTSNIFYTLLCSMNDLNVSLKLLGSIPTVVCTNCFYSNVILHYLEARSAKPAGRSP